MQGDKTVPRTESMTREVTTKRVLDKMAPLRQKQAQFSAHTGDRRQLTVTKQKGYTKPSLTLIASTRPSKHSGLPHGETSQKGKAREQRIMVPTPRPPQKIKAPKILRRKEGPTYAQNPTITTLPQQISHRDLPSTGQPPQNTENDEFRGTSIEASLNQPQLANNSVIRPTLQDLRNEARQKRKSILQSGLGSSSKRPQQLGREEGPTQAEIDMNPEGYYEARVDNDHCTNLGDRCGFTSNQIMHTLREDNSERDVMRQKIDKQTNPQAEPESDFRFDTDEEMESEE